MERLKNVDTMKGIAILMVVILHAIFCQPSLETGSVSSNPFVDLLYAGLIIFIIFSGYFYRPERTAKENITKRLVQLTLLSSVLLLVLPAILYIEYLIVGIHVVPQDFIDCLYLLIGGDNVFSPIDTSMTSPICGMFPGYYYVQMIVVSFIIFYLIARWTLESKNHTIISIAAMLIIEMVLVGVVNVKLPFYAHLAPICVAFMIAGAAAKKYDLFEYLDNGWKSSKYWKLFIIDAVICAVLLVFLPPLHSFDSAIFGNYGAWSIIPYYFTMLFCTYLLLVLVSMLDKIPVFSDAFCIIGRHSLALLLLHAFVIKLISVPIYGITVESWFPKMPTDVSIAIGLAAVIIITVCAELFARYMEKRRLHLNPHDIKHVVRMHRSIGFRKRKRSKKRNYVPMEIPSADD